MSRSNSPARAGRAMGSLSSGKRPIDKSSDTYRGGMAKLIDASWRFDKERNDYYLKTLENKRLDKELFRQSLRMSMNCRLSPEEFDSLLPHFESEGGGFVDGCEFLLLFYRVRYEFRSKLLTERIAIEKRFREANKEFEEKRRAELAKKIPVKVSYEFTEEDQERAIEKMTESAVLYDRSMPGAVQLDAFDCEYMPPEVFNQQLRRCFNMHLNPSELGAFIRWLNRDSSEEDVNINCANFLVNFFRTGFETRSARLRESWARKKKINDAKEARRKEEQKLLQEKNNLKCSLDFTAADKESAYSKLRTAARLYDKAAPGCMSMQAFEVAHMPPHVFKESLKRVFNLRVSPGELGALTALFDPKKEGHVLCRDFSKQFLAMGFAEREKELFDYREKQRLADERRLVEEQRKREEVEKKNAMKFSYDYTEDDEQSAMEKIELAAWRFDKSMPGAANLEAFTVLTMEPKDFRQQTRKAFDLKLTPTELGAALRLFGADDNGVINCKEFLNKFLRMGIEDRHRRHAEWLKHDAEMTALRLKEEEDKVRAQENKMVLTDIKNFSEADFQNALSKLTIAATKYHGGGADSEALKAFQVVSMPPHIFKEQIKMAFNVKVSIPELGALMSYFDKECTGEVNCKDFLLQFFRTGIDERDRIRGLWRSEQRSNELKAKKRDEDFDLEKQQRAAAEADYNFTEADFDSALEKIILMCKNFDKRQLGPAGFAAFTSESLAPGEFREMGKRTFNLKINSRELGAIVTYYDINGNYRVNCNAFLNSFVQIRVQTEEYKGRSDEDAKLKEYHARLKDAYKLKIQRQASGGDQKAKPWRSKGLDSPERAGAGQAARRAGPTKTKYPFPQNAQQKLNIRIKVSKDTNRLDLSTKTVWQDSQGKGVLEEVSATLLSDSNVSIDLSGGKPDNSFQLNFIPDVVYVMQQLKELWLCNNRIQSISPQISSLYQLRVLSLKRNQIATLPPEVVLLERLQKLFLGHNMLKVLPDTLKKLTNLTEINLASNMFLDFPPVLCAMPRLRLIDVSKNKLTAVPMELRQLKSLTYLSLDNNYITKPPEVFLSMHWLDVTGCVLPVGEKASCKFKITYEDEDEIAGMLGSRADQLYKKRIAGNRKSKTSDKPDVDFSALLFGGGLAASSGD